MTGVEMSAAARLIGGRPRTIFNRAVGEPQWLMIAREGVLAARAAPVAEHTRVSIQESTTGAVAQLLEREGCECLQSIKLFAFLAGALQRYEEEGVVLNPRVLLCESIEKFTRSLPGGRYLVVGRLTYNSESGKQILKQCANLSRAGWTIFVERSASGSDVRFGVLSFLASPTSIDLREMVTLGQDPSLGSPDLAVLVEKLDPKTVIFSGSQGNTLRIAFSTTRVSKDDTGDLRTFSDLCCSKVGNEEFSRFFYSLLGRALNESHGTILVCRNIGPITDVKGMSDAVMLDPPLNLQDVFMTYKSAADANSILDLQRSEALLVGMMQSDGIVVFDDQGSVSAYRVFFRGTTSLKPKGATTSRKTKANLKVAGASTPAGGARRRAFEGLRPLVGAGLQGILFRSQDGVTEFGGA